MKGKTNESSGGFRVRIGQVDLPTIEGLFPQKMTRSTKQSVKRAVSRQKSEPRNHTSTLCTLFAALAKTVATSKIGSSVVVAFNLLSDAYKVNRQRGVYGVATNNEW